MRNARWSGILILPFGLALLSRLAVDTPAAVAAGYMIVLGLGLGCVLQVLVLAAQNAVDYEFLGVATSGTTLFRQVGGSIGVSVFGAIFANQLASNLAGKLPAGAHAPVAASPALLKRLPPAIHVVYVAAVADALHPVFLAAAGIAALGFVLSWFLREVPLKKTAQARDIGDGFHGARDDDRKRELERALSLLAGREHRWELYERLAEAARVDLAPPELWLLARLGHRQPITEAHLVDQLHVDQDRVRDALDHLLIRSLVDTSDDGLMRLTGTGQDDYDRIVEARCARLRAHLDGWDADRQPEIQELVDRLGRDLVHTIPAPAKASA